MQVTLVPWDTPLVDKMDKFDGLFLSNGPGDPSMAKTTSDHVKEVLDAMQASLPMPMPLFNSLVMIRRMCFDNEVLPYVCCACAS